MRIMPKHTIFPPFKSALVISKSKDFQKYMTTIPKPVVTSKWNSWNMIISRDNKLFWYPTEYEEILNHLVDQWNVAFTKSFDEFSTDENILYFIYYNSEEDISSVKAWKIQKKKQIKLPGEKWNWKFNRDLPVYLIYVQHYEMRDSTDILRNIQAMRNIIEAGLRIILCNT